MSSTLPRDSAPRVTSPVADEGSMQHTISELTTLCTSLQRQHSELLAKFQAQEVEILRLKERVQVLEDREGVAAKQSGDDAPIKGKSINEREAGTERISNDSEDIARVLTSMDAATVLAGGIDVPTEEELQGMIDSLDKSNETIAKYLQEYQDFASDLPLEKRIELISDLVKYQENFSKVYKFQSQQRRPMTKKQKREYYMAIIKNNLGWKVKDFKGMTFEEIEAKFAEVWKQVEDFIPMGSKEEAERLKRKGLNLEQEHDLVKEYLSIRPATSKKKMELWVELKRLYEPDPEDQLWTLTQNFMHAPLEWKLYDLNGVHHLTAKDKEIFMLVEKDYPLRKGLALVMISYKLQKEHQVYGRIVGNKMHKAFPLPEVCTLIEEKKKKLPVKDRWQLH
uniref:Uncharacterized protein n=1 Tax=Tanacetum cinerariifolium TaxID=118510 RepID=A0A699KZC2_TANCI|nr:hypothetical protein [Tanacetum cinerariifolium]